VSGPDAQTFLQGLITVDMRKLSEKQLVAGAFLNPKGRILHDVLISKRPSAGKESADSPPVYDVETATSAVDDLVGMLKRFKLRKKVTIQPDETRKVFAVWGASAEQLEGQGDALVDPRPGHALGRRLWTSQSQVKSVQTLLDEAAYHQIRIAAGIAEGPEESGDELPFVLNFDWWPNTLAFDKGCYTGQELIARTHFKGQVRKRIMPVLLSTESSSVGKNDLLPEWTSWKIDGTTKAIAAPKSAIEPIPGMETKVGEGTLLALAPGGMVNIGLAAFKDAQAVPPPPGKFVATHQIKTEQGDVIKVCPIRPHWWPSVESV